MKDRFYIPFSMKVQGISLIVYLLKDENPLDKVFDPKNKNDVKNHIRTLYKKHKEFLCAGMYHIVFLWNFKNKRMTDVWIHTTNLIAAPSGPLQKVYTYCGLERYNIEVASGDTLIVLAREEELRRKVGDINKYLERPKYIPDFPCEMQPYEDFFT